MSPILLSLIILLVSNFPHAQSTVCSYSCSTGYYTRCGVFDWDRCARYRSKTCYRCCFGWSGSTKSGCATPICSPSCSNGGTCTNPDYCSNCNRGRYSPDCSRCRSIANCVDVYCSSYSNQRCGGCEGDYGSLGAAYKPSEDNLRCIKQCSWRTGSNACYPGTCTSGQCTCSSGFSGQDCRTMGPSQAPVISEHRAFLIKGNMALESPVFQNSTDSTVYTDVTDFTNIRVVWKVSYQATGLPSRPPYIRSAILGVTYATTSISVRTAQGSEINMGSKSCFSSRYSPRTNLVECEFAKDINYRTWTPSTGDVIWYEIRATSGGRLSLSNRDSSNSLVTRYYTSATARASSSFTFALSGATHCVRGSNCRTTMLDVGDNVVTRPGITVTWGGWSDRQAGIKEYMLEVRQLSGTVGDEMTEIRDTPPVYQGVSDSGLTITLPHTGVYSFVLSVVDNVDNERRCRRFVLFDSDPDDVTTRDEFPMRVLTPPGGWQTLGGWLNDIRPGRTTRLILDWQGHFANEIYLSQGFLKPIGRYTNGIIDADYDQNFGKRGRAAVTNALGVKKFRFFNNTDHSGGRTITNVSDDNSDHWYTNEDTQAAVSPTLADGDSIRFWVEARDLAGHYVRDSVLVHVDSSPPVIEDTKIAVADFALRAFDAHSGIKTIDWWLFDNETYSVVESGHEVVVAVNVTENTTICEPPACLCTPLGDCYATTQGFKPTLLAGIKKRDFVIVFSVTNNAGLARNETVKPTLTAENVGIFADALVNDTDDALYIDDSALAATADLLDNIVNIQDTSPEVTEKVVKIVSNLLHVNASQLGYTEAVARSFSRIVRSLNRQISNVLAAGGNASYVTENLAVTAAAFHSRDLADGGLGFAAVGGGGEEPTDLTTFDQLDVYGPDREVPVEEVAASVELPAQIADRLPGADSILVSFILYESSRLFRSQLTENATGFPSGVSTFIDSWVIAADVQGARITDLPDEAPVVTAFLQDKGMKNGNPEMQTTECVFWDFSLRDGIGEWSTEGCRMRPSVAGRTVCHCNHTTNFAVLVSIHSPVSSFILDVFSKIGCSVSVAALIITILVYTVIKSLRSLEASRILVSFCSSLLLLYLVFLAGVGNTSSRKACIIAAVLMHYFALTSVAWMGVEAANLYLKLVKVFNSDVQHFVLKASIVAWGLPMIVVIIILAVDYTEYDNQNSCFLKPGPAFYFGELLVIGLVLLFNLFVFMLVIWTLTCGAGKVKSASDESKRAAIARRLKSMVSVAVLLGLTWAFGLLSVIDAARFLFQALFCVFNSLQGLLIFLLFVVRQEKVREGVSNLLRRRRKGPTESKLTSTGRIKDPSVGFSSDGPKQVEADSSIYEDIDATCQPHESTYQDPLRTNAQSITPKGKTPCAYQDLTTTNDLPNNRPMNPKPKTKKKSPVIFKNYSTRQGEAPPLYDDVDSANDNPSSMQSGNKPTPNGKAKRPPAVAPKFRKKSTSPKEASRHYQNNELLKTKPTPGGKTCKKPPVPFKNRDDATKQGKVSHSYESTLPSQPQSYENVVVDENDYM